MSDTIDMPNFVTRRTITPTRKDEFIDSHPLEQQAGLVLWLEHGEVEFVGHVNRSCGGCSCCDSSGDKVIAWARIDLTSILEFKP